MYNKELRIRHFFNCTVPVYACNLRCKYCFVAQSPEKHSEKTGRIERLDADKIARALCPERVGGISMFNLCGLGETLLHNDVIDVTKKLLERGHYVSIVSNLTISNAVRNLCKLNDELKPRLFIKCSFQYEELERLQIEDVFFENVDLLRKNGISYTIEMVANDDSIGHIDEIKALFDKKGEAYPHILESRDNANPKIGRLTELSLPEHQNAWKQFETDLFEEQQKLWGEKRDEFCYAGLFSADIDLFNGNLYQCNGAKRIQNIYINMEEPLQYCAIGRNCPLAHCFISYVWQGLCGNISSIDYKNYNQLRNRTRKDGISWLQKEVNDIFSKKVSDEYTRYTIEKENIISELMSAYYSGYNGTLDNYKSIQQYIEEFVIEKKINKIGIFGFGSIGKLLKDLFDRCNVKVEIVIDNTLHNRLDNVISMEEFKCLEKKPCIDMWLITPLVDGKNICTELKEMYVDIIQCYTIFDLIEEMV